MEASWQPDPTGRHQYRWWDGAGWTESVADDGRTSVDPQWSAAAPATVAANPQPFSGPPVAPQGFGTPSGPLPVYAETPEPAKKGGIGKWIAIGAVLLVALGVGGFLIFAGGDDGDGGATGTFKFELTDDQRVVTKDIPMKRGEVMRIRVEPPPDMNTTSVLLLSREDATEVASAGKDYYSEFYSDSDLDEVLSDFYSDARDVFTDGDLEGDLRRAYGYHLDEDGGRGEPDSGGIVALADATYHLVIGASDEDSNGEIKVYIERYAEGPFTDLDDLSDVATDDPFFTDSGFFTDSEPYTPGS